MFGFDYVDKYQRLQMLKIKPFENCPWTKINIHLNLFKNFIMK